MNELAQSIATAKRYLGSFRVFSEFHQEEALKQLAAGQIGDDGFVPADAERRELINKTIRIGGRFTKLAADSGHKCEKMHRFLVLLKDVSDGESLNLARIDALVELSSLASETAEMSADLEGTETHAEAWREGFDANKQRWLDLKNTPLSYGQLKKDHPDCLSSREIQRYAKQTKQDIVPSQSGPKPKAN